MRKTLLAHRLRVLEALILLCFAWLCVRLIPFRITGRLLGRPEPGTPLATPCAETDKTRQRQALHVKIALRSAAARLPWTSTCLMQALAGRLMLSRRGVGSRTYFGVNRDMETGAFQAHAWLFAATTDVAGGGISDNFHPIATFAAGPANLPPHDSRTFNPS